jgi:hypothetical protein
MVDIHDPTSLFSDHSIQGGSPRTYSTTNHLNSLDLTTEPPVPSSNPAITTTPSRTSPPVSPPALADPPDDDEPTPIPLSPTVSVKTFTTNIDNVAKKSIRAHAEKRAKIIQELSARLKHSSMHFSSFSLSTSATLSISHTPLTLPQAQHHYWNTVT